MADLPGIYSLRTHSEEEEIAREYLCSGESDLLLVVCDATCLERGLHLLKQIINLEDVTLPSVILCVNLCDEAAKKGILLDFDLLADRLRIPVVPCAARNKKGLDRLKEEIYKIYLEHRERGELSEDTVQSGAGAEHPASPAKTEETVEMTDTIEAVNTVAAMNPQKNTGHAAALTVNYAGDADSAQSANEADLIDAADLSADTADAKERGLCRLCPGCPLCGGESCAGESCADKFCADKPCAHKFCAGESCTDKFCAGEFCTDKFCAGALSAVLLDAQAASGKTCPLLIPDFSPKELAAQAVSYTNPGYRDREEKLDRILTGRFTGSLLMILLLLGVFWLTITGANYPSAFLWNCFYRVETWLAAALTSAGVPEWFISASVYGVFRVVAWIVSVMLPPMAIFFPLFTLLEDLGYLPRVAFNMDCSFKKCKACGKQCLTMCMVTAPRSTKLVSQSDKPGAPVEHLPVRRLSIRYPL